MNLVLGSKASYTDEQVQQVWDHIDDHVSEAEAATAVDKAVAEVADRTFGIRRDRLVYGWSGGKDSQALRVVMEQAGIHRAVLGLVGKLEWTGYLKWVRDHAPEQLTIFSNDEIDLPWFVARPGERLKYLFPDDATNGYWWTLQGTRYAQRRYQTLYDPEMQIYGRRTQDGNVCGSDGITTGGGITSYNPIRNWPHELVLAVCAYFADGDPPLPVPPYFRPYGWTAATGAWPGRRVGDIDESWRSTFEIEPDVVRRAAKYLASARDWLEDNGHA